MQGASIIFLLTFSLSLWGNVFKTPLSPLPVNEVLLKADFELIEKAAGLPVNTLNFSFSQGPSQIKVLCQKDKINITIKSYPEEMTASAYKGLRELGFYFPHPRKQISPTLDQIKNNCGKTFSWKPKLKYRGFHLHTLHPNEWVAGFFQDSPEVAEDTVRWLARNNQNLLDVSLLRVPQIDIAKKFRPHFELARGLQIHTGVSLGIALQQQKSFKLLSLFESYFSGDSSKKVKSRLKKLLKDLPLSFIVLEAGSSEFTPTHFEKTLEWLNTAGKVSEDHGIVLLTKVHVSSNQHSKKWGNFNFLPQYAHQNVGILPHTVMFYGVKDESAPMYGNKDFSEIREFAEKEKSKRVTWYYPETSYWVGMDMDIPILLTDYLLARARDLTWLTNQGIEGQLNFTSGQALGHWLFDWSLALMTDEDYELSPLIGVKLLGEDLDIWEDILAYQSFWYKEQGLISALSAANLMDELTDSQNIHDRLTMRELSTAPRRLRQEIELLEESLKQTPNIDGVKNQELKSLLKITLLRQVHALHLRKALAAPRSKSISIKEAAKVRNQALGIIRELPLLVTNYPELPLFEKWKNPTSYQFGYVYPARHLYFWGREETQVREDSFFPFWNNIYSIWNIIF